MTGAAEIFIRQLEASRNNKRHSTAGVAGAHFNPTPRLWQVDAKAKNETSWEGAGQRPSGLALSAVSAATSQHARPSLPAPQDGSMQHFPITRDAIRFPSVTQGTTQQSALVAVGTGLGSRERLGDRIVIRRPVLTHQNLGASSIEADSEFIREKWMCLCCHQLCVYLYCTLGCAVAVSSPAFIITSHYWRADGLHRDTGRKAVQLVINENDDTGSITSAGTTVDGEEDEADSTGLEPTVRLAECASADATRGASIMQRREAEGLRKAAILPDSLKQFVAQTRTVAEPASKDAVRPSSRGTTGDHAAQSHQAAAAAAPDASSTLNDAALDGLRSLKARVQMLSTAPPRPPAATSYAASLAAKSMTAGGPSAGLADPLQRGPPHTPAATLVYDGDDVVMADCNCEFGWGWARCA
jgi:hypothetical protein